MSDFLDSLLLRSLERAEVVRPRLASLFEPPSPLRGFAGGPAFGATTFDPEADPA